MNFRRSRQNGCLRVFLLGRKLAGFDPAVTLPSDVDGERRVLEAVTDGIGNDGIADHFGPVIDRQLSGEHRGFVDRAFLEEAQRSCASVAVILRMPKSSRMTTSGLAILSRNSRYVPEDRASAKFSSHVVKVMYRTDLPLAQACSPSAWAMKV